MAIEFKKGTFPKEVIEMAQETERIYGVPASVTLAQFATESAYGTSGLATSANNYFGIIGSYNGNKVWRKDRYWRAYPDIQSSFDDHGRLLASSIYSGATAGAKDAFDYIDRMAPIYAPESDGNSGIADLWKTIIRQNNLTKYDSGNYGGGGLVASGDLSSGGGSTVVSSGSSGGTLADIGRSVLGAVIKGMAIIVLCVVAVVLFMNAFDITIPKKGGKANV